MKLLNPGYESEEANNSLWWNNKSGKCYNEHENATTTCDFTKTGLSDSAKSNLASSTWNVGSTGAYFVDKAYQDEIKASWTGKIGLMNLTDYIFAVDFDKCSPRIWFEPMSSNSNHKIVSSFL